ncbi:MAG TPA: hypothetical protein VJQ49_03180 [Casimicrobiaceae bacterium]|nr:hypothetical protein [Casimicrobiaceae bacterium]
MKRRVVRGHASLAEILGERRRRRLWLAGAIGAVLLAVDAFIDPRSLLFSYLFVWWFLLGIPLGSMAILMVHNMSGGAWGERIRPALEAALRLLPAMFVLSIPLWFGLAELYPWARPAEVEASALLQDKAWYLDPSFFFVRAVVYFVVWLVLARLLRKWSFARAADGDSAAAKRLRAISALGLLAYSLTVTLAAVDWIMSLFPQWYSTTFGLLVGIGQALCAFAFATTCAAWGHREADPRTASVFQDLGNLLLMFVMTWAYLAFTQYLITWAEDLPKEIVWYLPRVLTSWRWIAIALVVFHFALPFLVLLSRRAKRAPRALGALAAMLVVAHLVDAYWLVMPALRPAGFALGWSDLFAVLALGGVWLALFMWLAAADGAAPGAVSPRGEAVSHA